tara:strand:+ start:118 stop:468 length:351 start_codon:yes stop_codon:yes gene_type:complete
MTKEKIKTEDYREVTPYWATRLLLIENESQSAMWWNRHFFESRSLQKTIISLKGNTTFKPIDLNVMTLGYPNASDTEKILKIQHKGIEIRTGNTEWGAEPNKLYFVIKHGTFSNEV